MDYPIDKMELISELIRKGIEIDEATECQQATTSFPFVIQEEWPSKKGDWIEGQHFNLTQIPFDVEVDGNGFALDYQIAISFEIGNLKVSKENVMERVKERLKKMKIAIGSMIGEPIAIVGTQGDQGSRFGMKTELTRLVRLPVDRSTGIPRSDQSESSLPNYLTL